MRCIIAHATCDHEISIDRKLMTKGNYQCHRTCTGYQTVEANSTWYY